MLLPASYIFCGHHFFDGRDGEHPKILPALNDYDAHVVGERIVVDFLSIGFLYMPLAISALSKAKSIMTTFFAASMRSRASGLGIPGRPSSGVQ
jgi:hypothetical protein